MKILSRLLFPLLLLGACGNEKTGKPAPAETKTVPALAGKTYYFFSFIDPKTCRLSQPVDGGDWHLAFPDENHFFKLSYFMHDQTLEYGTYQWQNDSLLLHFDSVYVSKTMAWSELQPAKKNAQQYWISYAAEIKRVNRKPFSETIGFRHCSGGTPYLFYKEEAGYAEEDGIMDTLQPAALIEQLKKDSLWDNVSF